MSGGDIAGLIAAGVFAILVAILAVPVFKLGKVFDDLAASIRTLSKDTTPLIHEVTETVGTTHEQLKKVDVVSTNISDASANVSALSSLIAATIGNPLIKVASFSYGVRQAFAQRRGAGQRGVGRGGAERGSTSQRSRRPRRASR